MRALEALSLIVWPSPVASRVVGQPNGLRKKRDTRARPCGRADSRASDVPTSGGLSSATPRNAAPPCAIASEALLVRAAIPITIIADIETAASDLDTARLLAARQEVCPRPALPKYSGGSRRGPALPDRTRDSVSRMMSWRTRPQSPRSGGAWSDAPGQVGTRPVLTSGRLTFGRKSNQRSTALNTLKRNNLSRVITPRLTFASAKTRTW